jgi:hypothetical protein
MKNMEALILKCLSDKIISGEISDFEQLNAKLSPFGLVLESSFARYFL